MPRQSFRGEPAVGFMPSREPAAECMPRQLKPTTRHNPLNWSGARDYNYSYRSEAMLRLIRFVIALGFVIEASEGIKQYKLYLYSLLTSNPSPALREIWSTSLYLVTRDQSLDYSRRDSENKTKKYF